MGILRIRALQTCLSMLALSATFDLMLSSQTQPKRPKMDWPDATARLTEMRSTAETCVTMLKNYGKPKQILEGRMVYSNAKAKIDGAVSGLIVALTANSRPDSLMGLQSMIDAGSEGLVSLCDSTSKLVPRVPPGNYGGGLTDIAKEAIEPIVKAVSSAVAALYNNHRNDAELTRRTIQKQLEASKWPAFDSIPLFTFPERSAPRMRRP